MRLAEKLMAIPDPKLHVWFGLDCIPGVRDIDILLWHEMFGVFTIEVKAVGLRSIESLDYHRCRISGRAADVHPLSQALTAAKRLPEFLVNAPRQWIVATACWPLINRQVWNQSFSDTPFSGVYAEGMIFGEDLSGGVTALRQRLEVIGTRPSAGGARKGRFIHSPDALAAWRNSLSPEARPVPVPSDLIRLHQIERAEEEEALRDAPPTECTQLVYRGRPGTGKTFRLLRIGFRHALAGRRVLFVCFNKVLASDLWRIMNNSAELKRARGCLEIWDLYELLTHSASLAGIAGIQGNPESEGARIAATLQSSGELGKFDTVLVDEAQDMRGWALSFLETCATVDGTVCVARGTGQELYGDASEWLDQFESRAKPRPPLRRNFRNTQQVFQLAYTVYETRFKPDKIAAVVKRFGGSIQQTELEFARADGQIPQLHYASEPQLAGSSTRSFGSMPPETWEMTEQYRKFIVEQLTSLGTDERPMDLLILVPGERSPEYRWAVNALASIPGVEYIDYVADRNRRQVARDATVRLCTYHSARGVEGTRVLVFGIEHLMDFAERTSASAPNLGYIVLSRSVFELVVVVRGLPGAHGVSDFVEQVLAAIRRSPTGAATKPLLPQVELPGSREVLEPVRLPREQPRGTNAAASPLETTVSREVARKRQPLQRQARATSAVRRVTSLPVAPPGHVCCPNCDKVVPEPLKAYRGTEMCDRCISIMPR